MKAILLAAGYGTRLRPLTDTIPKCLVPIKGRPLLEIWLERLDQAGLGPFLINTHYLSEIVERFVRESPYSDKIKIVFEEELLGTAGTLLKNIDFFENDDGLLVHADNYCLADFKEFIRAHHNRPDGCLLTMMTFQTEDPSSCGIVEIDDRGVVQAFHEKVDSPPGNLANGAVYILSRELLVFLRSDMSDISDFSLEVIHKLIGKIYTYETKESFLDIGTPETYARVNA